MPGLSPPLRAMALLLNIFCISVIPPNCHLPASKYPLCTFAAFSAGICTGSSVRNDISGICAWHIKNGAPYLGHIHLNYILKGIGNLTPESSTQPARPPVTYDMLLLLHQHLDAKDPLHTVALCAANCSFWGQAWLGELLSTCEGLFDPAMQPAVSNLFPPSTTGGSHKLHVPFTKTTGCKGADIVLCKQLGMTDLIASLDNHLDVNQIPTNYPLFSFKKGTGHIALTKRKFLNLCNSVWTNFGFPTFTGHSFHIGGTTELLP